LEMVVVTRKRYGVVWGTDTRITGHWSPLKR
jgi:hypothetical protein